MLVSKPQRCFSHKRDNEIYLSLMFNDTKVELATSQKYLGLILDLKLVSMNMQTTTKINK